MNEESGHPVKYEMSEAEHLAAEAMMQPFSYKKPDTSELKRSKRFDLGKTDIVRGVMQVWKTGGETDLHYHALTDSLWIVIKGRATFYGPDNVLIGEFGEQEGVIMPRGARYWFENSEEDDLEILQVVSSSVKGAKGSSRTIIGPARQDGAC